MGVIARYITFLGDFVVQIKRFRCALCWTFIFLFGGLAFAEEQHLILLSARESIRHETLTLNEHVPAVISESWDLQLRTLHGGTQEGVQLLSVNNGELILTIVLNRGMSILKVEDARTGEDVFGWYSPVKEVVNPQFIDLESRGGLGWLYGFNEWLVRCGLEFAGHPGRDVMRSNTGEEKELDLTLHGRIGNIPASEVHVVFDVNNPRELKVNALIEERMFYGPQLRLDSTLTINVGERLFKLDETVKNLSAGKQEYQIIYHTNFGRPLLEEGSKVVLAAKQITPMNDHAAKSLSTYNTYSKPTEGFTEQVYLVEPWADENGLTASVLHTRDRTRGAQMIWSIGTLPYLTIWKNTAAESDGYVTGIEPGSGYPFNRRIERHFGRVPTLDAGESRTFSISFEFLNDENSVRNALENVDRIRNDRETVRNTAAPKLPDFE